MTAKCINWLDQWFALVTFICHRQSTNWNENVRRKRYVLIYVPIECALIVACDVKYFIVIQSKKCIIILKMIVQEPIQVITKPHFPWTVSDFSFLLGFYLNNHLIFPQVIVWDCLNNYEYDNAIFLAERLHAEGNFVFIFYPHWWSLLHLRFVFFIDFFVIFC